MSEWIKESCRSPSPGSANKFYIKIQTKVKLDSRWFIVAKMHRGMQQINE